MSAKAAYYLALAALAGMVAAFFMLAQYSSRGGEGAPPYSVYRSDPYGTAALKDLLTEKGKRAAILLEPSLPPGARGTLIQVLPRREFPDPPERPKIRNIPMKPGSKSETRELDDPRGLTAWVMAGNTLVVLARGVPPHMWRLGFAQKAPRVLGWVTKMEDAQMKGTPPDKIAGEAAMADWGGAAPDKGMRLALHEPVILADRTGGALAPIAWTDKGPVAMERKLGAGRVILVGDPSPVLNGWMEKGGNLEFVLSLTGPGTVYFDEWSHGMGHGGSLIGLMERFGLIPALLQVIFVLALYILAGRAIGAGEPEPSRERVSAMEQVDALGRLYARTMKPAAARQRVAQEMNTRVHEALAGAAGGAAAAMERAPAGKRERLKKILELAGRLEKAMEEKTTWKDLAAALTLSRELTKEKKDG